MVAVHLGFLTVQNFNCHYASEGQYASPCQISHWSVKPLPRYGRFLIVPHGGCSFLCYTPVWTTHIAIFSWNRCTIFDNMQILIFSVLGLKMPSHAPFRVFLGKNEGKQKLFAVLSFANAVTWDWHPVCDISPICRDTPTGAISLNFGIRGHIANLISHPCQIL